MSRKYLGQQCSIRSTMCTPYAVYTKHNYNHVGLCKTPKQDTMYSELGSDDQCCQEVFTPTSEDLFVAAQTYWHSIPHSQAASQRVTQDNEDHYTGSVVMSMHKHNRQIDLAIVRTPRTDMAEVCSAKQQ